MKKYTCYNCNNFSSIYAKDIKRHFNLKNRCKKVEDSFIYSNDQILLLSLFPDNMINSEELKKISNSNILFENKNEIFDIIFTKNKNRNKECNICNKRYEDGFELRKHILLDCFIQNKNKEKEKNINENSIHSNNMTHCTINKDCTINNNINNNIKIEVKYPVSFKDDWDTTHLDFDKLNRILISNYLMTSYLEEILKNDSNLNVILDINEKDGLVFDENKYIKMNKEEITDKTMEKINSDISKLLQDEEKKERIFKKILEDVNYSTSFHNFTSDSVALRLSL
jgi:hypothetical protein